LAINAQAGCGVACLCLLYCNENRFYSDGNALSQQRKPSFAATETIFCSNGNYPLQQLKLSFAATEIIFSTMINIFSAMINHYYSYDTIIFTAKGRLS